MQEDSTPSPALALPHGSGITMYTSAFQEVIMPQSSLHWALFSGVGDRSCDTMLLRPGHRLHRSTHFLFQTDVARDELTYTSLLVVLPSSIYAQLLSVLHGSDIVVALLFVGVLRYRPDGREGRHGTPAVAAHGRGSRFLAAPGSCTRVVVPTLLSGVPGL